MVERRDPMGPTFLAAAEAVAGRRRDALAHLKPIEDEAARTNQNAFLVAVVYAALGDKDQTFKWLETAYDRRDTFLAWLNANPEFDSVRDDRRFGELVERIGIPGSK